MNTHLSSTYAIPFLHFFPLLVAFLWHYDIGPLFSVCSQFGCDGCNFFSSACVSPFRDPVIHMYDGLSQYGLSLCSATGTYCVLLMYMLLDFCSVSYIDRVVE
jgi:hypothetical protein